MQVCLIKFANELWTTFVVAWGLQGWLGQVPRKVWWNMVRKVRLGWWTCTVDGLVRLANLYSWQTWLGELVVGKLALVEISWYKQQHPLFCCFFIVFYHFLLFLYFLSSPLPVVMGPGQKFLTRVKLDQFFVARVWSSRVSHLWFGFEFGKFPLKRSNFSIFCPSGQKKSLRVGSESTGVGGGSPLFYCGSKVSSGQGPSLPSSLRDETDIIGFYIY